jgi:hypothetical protein
LDSKYLRGEFKTFGSINVIREVWPISGSISYINRTTRHMKTQLYDHIRAGLETVISIFVQCKVIYIFLKCELTMTINTFVCLHYICMTVNMFMHLTTVLSSYNVTPSSDN